MLEVRALRGRRRLAPIRLAVVAGATLLAAATLAAPAAHAAPADDIRINEVVTTGSVDDSIELFNKGAAAVDISGWVLKDDDTSHTFTVPAGTTLAPGAARAFTVAAAFGLGSSDKARLYLPGGSTLVDSFGWSAHSAPSWSRCPDGTGAFGKAAVTLGAPNGCGSGGGTNPVSWPGGSSVSTADGADVFGEDLSGLYQEGSVLWAAQNSGKLWRLVRDGSGGWRPDTADGWTSGKSLRYPGGSGSPDGEAVTLTAAGAAGGAYVATERNGDASGTSRLSVLRYEVATGTGSSLTATKEWNLTAGLPAVGSNLGFEAITWIPDTTLVAAGFKDESTGAAYDPNRYGAHTGGVFLLGVEGTGAVHAYVLQDSGTATRVATLASGMAGVMELQWEPQAARLWTVCDDTCGGLHKTMKIGSAGTFAPAASYQRPSGMPDLNNEGFAVAGADECVSGTKPVYWSDDSNTGGHALRRGTIAC
ncbi:MULTISPECIES: lamin tail domain-containing protein [unclassified Streptomyces]|uniref:lamin tail domain-containing protein n=1 Tax=unclassified Streptomyces TaxID=2593676 RepID=UPI0016565173|nr:lamin tail domain-containing protein [Streptomyces sp. CB02980]MCB8904945.1 lamin tail domain-containing protein [Streptomyces sp. CB02980]